MAIPDFQSTMLPVLKSLSDGKEHSNGEISEAVVKCFDLSEEEKSRLLPSKKQPVIINRLRWATSYLKQAGLIEAVKRGIYKITDEGITVIESNPEKINVNFLMKYPSFAIFRQGKSNSDQAEEAKAVTEDTCSSEKTPEEYIEFGINSVNQSLKQELISTIKKCSPYFFERLVVDLLLAMGYGGSRQEAGRLTNKGSDEGIDGIINEDKLGLDVIYIQAKKWEGSVSRPEIQKFAGALQGKRASKGIYITTSCFTKEAHEYARSITSRIILIDGDKLAELMVEYDVGVNAVQVFKLKKIDSDYFIEE